MSKNHRNRFSLMYRCFKETILKNPSSLPSSLEKPLYKGIPAWERLFLSLPYLSLIPPVTRKRIRFDALQAIAPSICQVIAQDNGRGTSSRDFAVHWRRGPVHQRPHYRGVPDGERLRRCHPVLGCHHRRF